MEDFTCGARMEKLGASWLSAITHISRFRRVNVNQDTVKYALIAPLLNSPGFVAQGFKAFMLLSL